MTNDSARGRPPRAPSPVSPTSSPKFRVRLIDFGVAIGVHASSTSSSLPADIVVECSYVLAINESPPYWRRRTLLLNATAASRRHPQAAYVTIEATSAPIFCDMTITPLQFAFSVKGPVLRVFSLITSIPLGKKNVNVFMRRDFDAR